MDFIQWTVLVTLFLALFLYNVQIPYLGGILTKVILTTFSGIWFLVIGIFALGIGRWHVDADGIEQFIPYSQIGNDYMIFVFIPILLGIICLLYLLLLIYAHYKFTVKGLKSLLD